MNSDGKTSSSSNSDENIQSHNPLNHNRIADSGNATNSNSNNDKDNNSQLKTKGDFSDAATPETGEEGDDERTASREEEEEEQSQISILDQHGASLSSFFDCNDEPEHEFSEEGHSKSFLTQRQTDEGGIPQFTTTSSTTSSVAPVAPTPHRGPQSVTVQKNTLVRHPTNSRQPPPSNQQEEDEPSILNPDNEDDDDEHDDDKNDFIMDDYSVSSRPPPDETRLWKARLLCGQIVNNDYVQISIIFLIIINSLMMGIATGDFVTDNPRIDHIFDKVDRAFLVVFTLEVAIQLFYLGLTLFADGWLVFDFFIVVFSWSFESLQIVRAFRIFRAFRLITRVKPLRDLVLAIGAVLPRMYAIAALLLLVFYIFSVLFTELFKDLPLSDNYFGTLDASLFTCMEMMTLEWGEIAREVMEYYAWAWAPFVTFIAMTGFIVFNLIVAVVCDAVALTEKTVRELDGIEEDNAETRLEEAQERIDLLQCHISDMLRTQLAVQDMIEVMAGELLHLEAERVKSEKREADLRLQFERRMTYERDMNSTRQMQIFEKSVMMERERRETERTRRLDLSHHRDDDDHLDASGSSGGGGGFGRKLANVTVGSDAAQRIARRMSSSGGGKGERTSRRMSNGAANLRLSAHGRSPAATNFRKSFSRDNSNRTSKASSRSSISDER